MNVTSSNNTPLKASLIIAVYKDVEALHAILLALKNQSEKNFEVIVTEDGESTEMAEYFAKNNAILPNLHHLTQVDNGWRKTAAVNRAIQSAQSDYLIFIDGDCIPRFNFIESHVQNKQHDKVCTARRVNLGPIVSKLIRKKPGRIKLLENRLFYFFFALPLHIDKIRDYEVGFASKLLHFISRNRYLGIMGCNFSCYKSDMLKINGYNEDLPGAGGEDDDLEWRFNGMGIVTKSIKFITPNYHLYHPVQRHNTEVNQAISRKNKEKKQYFCLNGIVKENQPT